MAVQDPFSTPDTSSRQDAYHNRNLAKGVAFNPLSPNINKQILQTPYISLKNKLGHFDKRSKHFLFGDYFINSHNLYFL